MLEYLSISDSASFYCRGQVNWLPLLCIQFYSMKTEMHSLLPSALCWHEQIKRWMSAVSIKSPWISCEGVNTSQELLLFCSTLAECRKKWTCGVAFIVQEMFGNPQEYIMSGTACWTCEVQDVQRPGSCREWWLSIPISVICFAAVLFFP